MEAQTIGIFHSSKTGYHSVDIFAYSSRSCPGLNIMGLGRYGMQLSEKFKYLVRTLHLRVPPRKYVLCVEEHPSFKELNLDELKNLELPLFLLFLYQLEAITMGNLHLCASSGKISAAGEIALMCLPIDYKFTEEQGRDRELRWIGLCHYHDPTLVIPVEQLFENIPGLRWKELSQDHQKVRYRRLACEYNQ